MRTCVGWFSLPACALIYHVAKYVALCSSQGYAIGQKNAEWIEARLADSQDQTELLGDAEDLLANCGSRMYVFFLDAAVTEHGGRAIHGDHLRIHLVAALEGDQAQGRSAHF